MQTTEANDNSGSVMRIRRSDALSVVIELSVCLGKSRWYFHLQIHRKRP